MSLVEFDNGKEIGFFQGLRFGLFAGWLGTVIAIRILRYILA